jgi:hypothetical protein
MAPTRILGILSYGTIPFWAFYAQANHHAYKKIRRRNKKMAY